MVMPGARYEGNRKGKREERAPVTPDLTCHFAFSGNSTANIR
jgi:hypothetical protein